MTYPKIERIDVGSEIWEPHLATKGYATPVYKLAAEPFMPYDKAKLAANVVTTPSLFVAAKLVEQGFRIRMRCAATNEQNMIQPSKLKITW